MRITMQKKHIVVLTACTTMLIALAVITGWVFNIPELKNLLPESPAIKFNTAVCFFISGLLLYMSNNIVATLPKKILIPVCSWFLIALSLLTLMEYVFNWNAGIDELFFKDNNHSFPLYKAGRMSALAAINFFIIGLLFLFYSKLHFRRSTNAALILMFIACILILLNQILGPGYLDVIPQITYTPVPALLLFCMLLTGIFYSNKVYSAAFSFQKKITVFFAFTVFLLLFIFYAVNKSSKKAIETSLRLEQNSRLLLNTEYILDLTKDMETDFRDFLITGNEAFLDSYYHGVNKINKAVASVNASVKTNRRQQVRIDSLTKLIELNIDFRKTFIDLRRKEGNEPARRFFATMLDKSSMDSIRRTISEISAEENNELAKSKLLSRQSIYNAERVIFVSEVIVFLLVLGSLAIILKNTYERNIAQSQIKKLNSNLEEQVRVKIAENVEKGKQYRFLIENMKEGIAIIAFNWQYLFVNNAAALQLKRAAAELIGKNLLEINPGIENTLLFAAVQRCMKERTAVNVEEEYIYVNGKADWFEYSIQPVPEGIFIRSVCITERKEIAQSLQDSENYLRAIIYSSPECIKTLGPNGELLDMNPAGLEILEADELNELKGKSLLVLIKPTHRPAFIELLNKIFDGKTEVLNYEVEGLKGTSRWLETHAVPLRDSAGKVISMLSITADITARKKSEALLKEQEELLKSILNTSVSGIMYFKSIRNTGGGIIDFEWQLTNATAEKMVGKTNIELLGKKLLHEMPGNKEEGLFDLYTKVVKTGRMLHHEQYYNHEGVEAWFHIVAVKLYDGFVVTFTDITNKKKEELRLKLLESVVTNTNDAIIITGAEPFNEPGPKILYVNEAFCRMTGYTAEEVIGQSSRLLQGPKTNQSELKRLGDALSKWQSCAVTIINYKKNGEEFWVNITVNAVADTNGLYTHWVAIQRDVTENKLAEQKLKSERNFLRTLIDNLPDTIYYKDVQGRKLISNKVDYQFLGAGSEKEVLGKTDKEIFQQNNTTIGYEHDMQILKTGKPLINFEECFTQPNGKPMWLLTSKIPMRNEEGETVGILGIGKNITDRKKAEEKLKELNNQLAKNIQQLTLSNTELARFAHVASHDLQEPLRMITSFVSLLEKKLEGQLDATAQQYIYYAVDGASRMKKLIEDLLKYSSVGNNKDGFAEIDCNDVVATVTSLNALGIKEQQAIVHVHPLPVIYGVMAEIQQLFQNLIGNALKYHGSQPPVIEIGCKDNNDYWEFYVKDNGIGVEPKFFDKIFIIFQRLHSRAEYSGTGIGLAICKKIAEKHGGRIWIDSKPVEGATFYFTIAKKINIQK